ncbi:MAG: multifunctional 2-oxoglutarate metabolism enzyme, partial [Actinomycetota bacterium]|nr:multifunctional 2-oxoglutarate metabolism enzyme [Actinomycetota bacterium]
VRRVVLCTGKITWDLLAARRANEISDVAVVRVERLYPMPGEEIAQAVSRYPDSAEIVWVQEEPMNQGAYQYMAINLPEFLPGRALGRISRSASAAPSTGSHRVHEQEQRDIVTAALG